jgi:hypothetical protein
MRSRLRVIVESGWMTKPPSGTRATFDGALKNVNLWPGSPNQCQRLRDGAHAVYEKLRGRAERAAFYGDDRDSVFVIESFTGRDFSEVCLRGSLSENAPVNVNGRGHAGRCERPEPRIRPNATRRRVGTVGLSP